LEVKFGQVSIIRPQKHPDKELLTELPLQVVQVKETADSVVNNEKPVHWILFTSHPVETVEMAMQIVQWYRWRWVIEQVFRALKSKGLNIEKSTVESYEALVNLSTLALIAAVQVLQLTQARDGGTDQQISEVFSAQEQQCLNLLNKKVEGNTALSKNPHPPEKLAFATWIIARLGGWKGHKKSRPSGLITFLKGMIRFNDIFKGFYLLL
jgi:hypothetical protein